MTEQKSLTLDKPVLMAVIVIFFSGICWYLSNGLGGDLWYLLWIAPVPVLVMSFFSKGSTAFFISFVSYLIGRFSWFNYLVRVATPIPAVIFTLALPLFFALIVVLTRKIVIKTGAWYSVFAFPVLFTTYEFLVMKFSAVGTAGSIAYSQSNFIPLIQIASFTGILGITFLVTLFPSAMAVGWFYSRQKTGIQYPVVVVAGLISAAILYGVVRINTGHDAGSIEAGLAVLDEKAHLISDSSYIQKDKPVAEAYVAVISRLASKGARVIVLPERAVNMNKKTAAEIIGIFGAAAKENHVFIIAGYTNARGDQERNSAFVLDDEGRQVADYNKVHLVNGFEHQFVPGKEPGLFSFNFTRAGTAICKDLDFPDHINKYGQDHIGFLCVPAWDFEKDDWLHSRMAILRGVENGFSEIRTARKGQLTISDCYGSVNYEASASKGQAAELLGKVSLQQKNTVYTRFGNWFGIMNAIAFLFFVFLAIGNRHKETTV